MALCLRANIWPSTTATFNVDIRGAEGLWNTAFETAMFRWSVAGFDYRINQTKGLRIHATAYRHRLAWEISKTE